MRKLIEITHESLLKCDNKECDHIVPWNDKYKDKYISAYIDEPCPKCGENLLTEVDYKTYIVFMGIINFINKWFSWILYLLPLKRFSKNEENFKVNVHKGIKIEKQDKNGNSK